MKKLLAIMLAVVLMFTFAACSSNSWEDDMKEYEKLIDDYAAAEQAGEDTDAIEEKIAEMDEKMEGIAESLEGDEAEEFQKAAMELYERITSKYGDIL